METIRQVSNTTKWDEIAAVFNHYVSVSTAAYPTQPLNGAFFQENWKNHQKYPFIEAVLNDQVVGFSYMRPFHPADSMNESVVFTYFISPSQTGKGIGRRFITLLLEEAKKIGKTNVLVNISSDNRGSIKFHSQHGFRECGRFAAVGKKNGKSFDMVWMQKLLSETPTQRDQKDS